MSMRSYCEKCWTEEERPQVIVVKDNEKEQVYPGERPIIDCIDCDMTLKSDSKVFAGRSATRLKHLGDSPLSRLPIRFAVETLKLELLNIGVSRSRKTLWKIAVQELSDDLDVSKTKNKYMCSKEKVEGFDVRSWWSSREDRTGDRYAAWYDGTYEVGWSNTHHSKD